MIYGVTMARMSTSLGLPVRLHLAVLTKHKTPSVQLIPVAIMNESVGQVWAAIQTGNFYPSPSPQNCVTCPFRSRWPAFAKS